MLSWRNSAYVFCVCAHVCARTCVWETERETERVTLHALLFFFWKCIKKVLSNIHYMHCDLFTFSKRKKKKNCGRTHMCVCACVLRDFPSRLWQLLICSMTSCEGQDTVLYFLFRVNTFLSHCRHQRRFLKMSNPVTLPMICQGVHVFLQWHTNLFHL